MKSNSDPVISDITKESIHIDSELCIGIDVNNIGVLLAGIVDPDREKPKIKFELAETANPAAAALPSEPELEANVDPEIVI
tara:strand:+ start:1017 stop:1259 length:243 start_codon:yes stop_codon:yes gene_type:complete